MEWCCYDFFSSGAHEVPAEWPKEHQDDDPLGIHGTSK